MKRTLNFVEQYYFYVNKRHSTAAVKFMDPQLFCVYLSHEASSALVCPVYSSNSSPNIWLTRAGPKADGRRVFACVTKRRQSVVIFKAVACDFCQFEKVVNNSFINRKKSMLFYIIIINRT